MLTFLSLMDILVIFSACPKLAHLGGWLCSAIVELKSWEFNMPISKMPAVAVCECY